MELHPTNLGGWRLGTPALPLRGGYYLLPALRHLVASAHVVVIGRGVTVGPLGLLLTRRSENATVTLCHRYPRPAALTRQADIVVARFGGAPVDG